jgi:hypothetical protein
MRTTILILLCAAHTGWSRVATWRLAQSSAVRLRILIVVLLFCILCALVFIGSELRWISKGIVHLLDRFGVPQLRG